MTISVGVVPMQLNDDLDSLINVADQALYQAKGLGRNRVHDNERALAAPL